MQHVSVFSRLLRNQKGVSLVEALVVAAVAGGLVAVVANYRNLFRSQGVTDKRACQAQAASILSAIQQETYYRTVVNWVPTTTAAANRTANSYGGGFGTTTAVQNSTFWWTGSGTTPFKISSETGNNGANGVTLQNFQLIEGTMRSLAAIYNNTPAIRCAYNPYAPLTTNSTALPWPAELQQLNRPGFPVNIQLNITPYDRTTGITLGPCPNAIYPAPKGPGEGTIATPYWTSAFAASASTVWNPPAANEGYKAGGPGSKVLVNGRMANRGVGYPNPAPIVRPDIGIEALVRIDYTNRDNQAEFCTASQKFEYPDDRTPPSIPTVTMTTNSTSKPSRPDCVPNNPTSAMITISQNSGDAERGVQFLCRDLSWSKKWTAMTGPPYNTGNGAPCLTGPAGNYSAVPTSFNTMLVQHKDIPAQQDSSLQENFWVPCDQVKQCGATPTAAYGGGAGANTSGNPGGGSTLTLTYRNLAPNYFLMSTDGLRACVFNMEVVAVDTAGNISVAGNPANRVFLEKPGGPGSQPIQNLNNGASNDNTTVDTGNEMIHSSCGEFVPNPGSTGNWKAPYTTQFPNGYWTCGGKCVDKTRGGTNDGLCTPFIFDPP